MVGIRCPDHELTRQLLDQLNFPLAAPSANPFGYISPTEPNHVNEQLGEKIAYILDGGRCRVGIESTIIGFEENQPILYRIGGVTIEQIENAIGPVKIENHSISDPKAPGQLKKPLCPWEETRRGIYTEIAEYLWSLFSWSFVIYKRRTRKSTQKIKSFYPLPATLRKPPKNYF